MSQFPFNSQDWQLMYPSKPASAARGGKSIIAKYESRKIEQKFGHTWNPHSSKFLTDVLIFFDTISID